MWTRHFCWSLHCVFFPLDLISSAQVFTVISLCRLYSRQFHSTLCKSWHKKFEKLLVDFNRYKLFCNILLNTSACFLSSEQLVETYSLNFNCSTLKGNVNIVLVSVISLLDFSLQITLQVKNSTFSAFMLTYCFPTRHIFGEVWPKAVWLLSVFDADPWHSEELDQAVVCAETRRSPHL